MYNNKKSNIIVPWFQLLIYFSYFTQNINIIQLCMSLNKNLFRYVLATGSTVFYAMLYGGLSGADTSKEVIEVPDVEPVAFLTMLKYLYCDEINLTPDNVLATLYCAKKYIVPHLVIELLCRNIFYKLALRSFNLCRFFKRI